ITTPPTTNHPAIFPMPRCSHASDLSDGARHHPTDPRSASGAARRARPAWPGNASERFVAVLAGLEDLALVGEGLEGRGDVAPGVGGVDDGVDVAALGGDVGVEEAV